MREPKEEQNTSVVLALPHLGDPRLAKRVSMLQDKGLSAEVIAYERFSYMARLPSCKITNLGTLRNGRYISRLFYMLRSVRKIRAAIKTADVIYAVGLDMAMICYFSGLGLGRPLILDVADITKIQTSRGLLGRCVRVVDRFITSQCCLLVATVPGFIEQYYRRWIGATTPALVIANKLDPITSEERKRIELATPRTPGIPIIDRPLRIGFFGSLRWVSSWETLKLLAESRPTDVEILVAGLPFAPPDLPQQAENYDNIVYVGAYRSPDDLPALFRSVDLIWAVYPPIGPDDWNLRWAKTNRFYEACFFGTPIISRKGCRDADEITRHKIGFVVDDGNEKQTAEAITSISADDLQRWRRNISMLSQETFVFTNEAEELASWVRRLAVPTV